MSEEKGFVSGHHNNRPDSEHQSWSQYNDYYKYWDNQNCKFDELTSPRGESHKPLGTNEGAKQHNAAYKKWATDNPRSAEYEERHGTTHDDTAVEPPAHAKNESKWATDNPRSAEYEEIHGTTHKHTAVKPPAHAKNESQWATDNPRSAEYEERYGTTHEHIVKPHAHAKDESQWAKDNPRSAEYEQTYGTTHDDTAVEPPAHAKNESQWATDNPRSAEYEQTYGTTHDDTAVEPPAHAKNESQWATDNPRSAEYEERYGTTHKDTVKPRTHVKNESQWATDNPRSAEYEERYGTTHKDTVKPRAHAKNESQWATDNPRSAEYEEKYGTTHEDGSGKPHTLAKHGSINQTHNSVLGFKLNKEGFTSIRKQFQEGKNILKSHLEKQMLNLEGKQHRLRREEGKSHRDLLESSELSAGTYRDDHQKQVMDIAAFNKHTHKLNIEHELKKVPSSLKVYHQMIQDIKDLNLAECIEDEDEKNLIKESIGELGKILEEQNEIEELKQNHQDIIDCFDKEAKIALDKFDQIWQREELSLEEIMKHIMQKIRTSLENKNSNRYDEQMKLIKERQELLKHIEFMVAKRDPITGGQDFYQNSAEIKAEKTELKHLDEKLKELNTEKEILMKNLSNLNNWQKMSHESGNLSGHHNNRPDPQHQSWSQHNDYYKYWDNQNCKFDELTSPRENTAIPLGFWDSPPQKGGSSFGSAQDDAAYGKWARDNPRSAAYERKFGKDHPDHSVETAPAKRENVFQSHQKPDVKEFKLSNEVFTDIRQQIQEGKKILKEQLEKQMQELEAKQHRLRLEEGEEHRNLLESSELTAGTYEDDHKKKAREIAAFNKHSYKLKLEQDLRNNPSSMRIRHKLIQGIRDLDLAEHVEDEDEKNKIKESIGELGKILEEQREIEELRQKHKEIVDCFDKEAKIALDKFNEIWHKEELTLEEIMKHILYKIRTSLEHKNSNRYDEQIKIIKERKELLEQIDLLVEKRGPNDQEKEDFYRNSAEIKAEKVKLRNLDVKLKVIRREEDMLMRNLLNLAEWQKFSMY